MSPRGHGGRTINNICHKKPANTHRPCEAEGEADWVGEAVRVGLRHLEGVGAEDGSHGTAVRAGRLGGDVGLVMLQTNPKEGLALALLVLALRKSRASGAAVAVSRYPLLVEELLQLQLKHSGAPTLIHTRNNSVFEKGNFRMCLEKYVHIIGC